MPIYWEGDVKIKNADVRIKAGPDDGLDEGQFTAYASVFGNVDSYGDRVVKGAFSETIKSWEGRDAELPLLFGHRFDDPDFNIGHVTKAVEDDHGLLVTAQLDLESPKAAQTYRLLKGRRVTQMSFAYDVVSHEVKDDAVNLTKLALHEVSVVPIGANQETEVLAVKAAADSLVEGAKAGRTISAANEAELRNAHASLGKVLSSIGSVEGEEEDQDEASDSDAVKAGASDKEPVGVTSSAPVKEPESASSVKRLAAITHFYALSGQEGA